MTSAGKALGVALWVTIVLPGMAAAQGDLPKLVSLDFCADQFAMALASPDQVMGLSPGAGKVDSFYRARAHLYAEFGGTTEEVLQMEPALVIRTWRGDTRSLRLFRQQGIAVVSATYGIGPETIFGDLEAMGRAMGVPEKTSTLVAAYRARLARLRAQPRTDMRAAYVTASGFSAGEDTFINDVILLAGFDSLAAELGLKGWTPVPLEAFVMDPPDLIIASFFDLEDRQPAGWNLDRHPRFAKLMKDIPTIIVPSRYLSCSGFFFVDAAAYIREQAIALGLFRREQP